LLIQIEELVFLLQNSQQDELMQSRHISFKILF